jgi:hypothetical protein
MIRRREFLMLLGGAAAWPLAARAQQGAEKRRVGVLMSGDEAEPGYGQLAAFVQGLRGLGWTDGQIFVSTFGGTEETPLAREALPPSFSGSRPT